MNTRPVVILVLAVCALLLIRNGMLAASGHPSFRGGAIPVVIAAAAAASLTRRRP